MKVVVSLPTRALSVLMAAGCWVGSRGRAGRILRMAAR